MTWNMTTNWMQVVVFCEVHLMAPALAEPAVEPSKPSETGWKDRTPVSWGCSSFLLGYPNLFSVKSHFIPHKTSNASGNKTQMVRVSVSISHLYKVNLKDIWQIYILKNSFSCIIVIVKGIVTPLKVMTEVYVCFSHFQMEKERRKDGLPLEDRYAFFMHRKNLSCSLTVMLESSILDETVWAHTYTDKSC